MFSNEFVAGVGQPVCRDIVDTPKPPSNCTAGTNPVIIASGNKYQQEVDYQSPTHLGLSFARTYNSIANNTDLGVGKRWRHNFNHNITATGSAAVIYNSRGDAAIFTYDGVNWVSDPDVSATLVEVLDGNDLRTGWIYTRLDDLVEQYSATGQLVSVVNRKGQELSLIYDLPLTSGGDDNLTTLDKVIGFTGAALLFTNETLQRITSITDPEGNFTSYTYDVEGNLATVTYPNSGGTRTYHYEDSNFPNALTGITDENGDRFATWAYDSAGRAISSEHHGGAEKVTIDYTNIDDAADPRAVATNVLGKQTTYHFANIFGARKVTQVEGHPSTNCAAANKNYSYDANGFVASKTDWKGNTTTYVRNTKGQELSRTEASGTAEACTITTEWHTTFNLRTKVTEPDRETVYSYDANGNLLSQQTNDLTMP